MSKESLFSRESEINKLHADQIASAKLISQYQTKLEYQAELISQFDKLKDDTIEITKNNLSKLGNELILQLLENHKKEAE
jgi:hypothetical protein